MNITKITVVKGTLKTDLIYLHTDMPGGCYPYDQLQAFTGYAKCGSGVEYCEKHFPGVKIEILDAGNGKRNE